MTAIDIKPNIRSMKRSRTGSLAFSNISLTSRSTSVDQRGLKYEDKRSSIHVLPSQTRTVLKRTESQEERVSPSGKGSRLDNQRIKNRHDVRHSDMTLANHRNLQANGESGFTRRALEKRLSLSTSTSLQARTTRGSSLPDGKIITHMNGRKMSEEELSSSRGTPNGNRRLKYTKLQKTSERRKMLYRKFQIYAKLTIFCKREANAHILRNKAYDEIAPYLNTLTFYEFGAVEDNELMFDISKFKADKQLRISEEAKTILGKQPFDRTEKELHYAQIALRNISSFAEYPMRMQRKIVEVGRYEKFGSKRVIVRQGHPASAFYFILSGSVVIMVYEGDTKVAKPVAYMKKGQTFGELAIIHRTTRQSTVVAKETIELLSIDIEDFHQIFMAGGVKNITDPDHNDFLRSLSILRNWPIEKMIEHPDQCVFHYFKRGEVLVKDSNYSDWIFIVKSGSLQVMKKLKRVEAYEANKKTEGEEKEFKNEKMKKEEKALLDKQRRYVLPDINIPLNPPVDGNENETMLALPSLTRAVSDMHTNMHNSGSVSSRLHQLTRRNSTKHKSQSGRRDNLSNSNQIKHLPPIHRSGTFHSSNNISWVTMPREPTVLVLNNKNRTVSRNIKTMPLTEANLEMANQQHQLSDDNKSEESSQNETVSTTNGHSKNSDLISNASTQRRPRTKHRKKKVSEDSKTKHGVKGYEQEVIEELVDKKNNIRTITQDLDSHFKSKDPDDFTEADLDPQFVHIQTLVKGQVFGVAELVLGQQPSFCLVSSGAECVMLNKHFYMQHASEALVRLIRHELSPYPTDREMQKELQAAIDWEAFKNTTFRSTLKQLSRAKDVSKNY